jgi:hypothetical protein
MFGRGAHAQADREARVASFYDSVVRMKKDTVRAADFISGCASVFVFMVERLEKHPAVYAAVDAVFHAKGHPLSEMKRDCCDIRTRLKSYVTDNHTYL